MPTRLLAGIILALALLAGALSIEITRTNDAHAQRIPACEEDQVLIGDGEFSAGRWDRYLCGPAVDDFDPSLGHILQRIGDAITDPDPGCLPGEVLVWRVIGDATLPRCERSNP